MNKFIEFIAFELLKTTIWTSIIIVIGIIIIGGV
jgi:hypothetical protein